MFYYEIDALIFKFSHFYKFLEYIRQNLIYK